MDASATATSAFLMTFGLEPAVADAIRRALPEYLIHEAQDVPALKPQFRLYLQNLQAPLVFCSADFIHLPAVLEEGRSSGLRTIVVTLFPEVSQWLDVMDAGAADYIASPFETHQLRWVLNLKTAVETPPEEPCSLAASIYRNGICHPLGGARGG